MTGQKTKKFNKNKEKTVNIKVLPNDFWLYSNPIILMMNFKGGKRAEAAQWALEVKKMLNGIVKSITGLSSVINYVTSNQKLYLENKEVIVSDEDRYWLALYLVDNAILRIYACLDKLAQMCRCYLEHRDKGGTMEVVRRCKCKEVMEEGNCNFGLLVTYLNTGNNKKNRDKNLIDALNKLNSDKAICNLRTYRNSFTHKKHSLDRTVGIDPGVSSEYKTDGTVETKFSFGGNLPPLSWFRIEITQANNAIVEFLDKVGNIIFLRDFNLPTPKYKV